MTVAWQASVPLATIALNTGQTRATVPSTHSFNRPL